MKYYTIPEISTTHGIPENLLRVRSNRREIVPLALKDGKRAYSEKQIPSLLEKKPSGRPRKTLTEKKA
jgi:hypothetical protein